MTSRERLLACINRKIPDCVPVAPDISNMVPAKRTGLRFWDIYLYRKVSLWKAYSPNCMHEMKDMKLYHCWGRYGKRLRGSGVSFLHLERNTGTIIYRKLRCLMNYVSFLIISRYAAYE